MVKLGLERQSQFVVGLFLLMIVGSPKNSTSKDENDKDSEKDEHDKEFRSQVIATPLQATVFEQNTALRALDTCLTRVIFLLCTWLKMCELYFVLFLSSHSYFIASA